MENISFSAKIEEQDLYKYNLHHAYTSSQGIFSILVAVLLLVAWALKFNELSSLYRVLYPVISLLFIFYIPYSLKLKSRQQINQEVFKYPLNYELTETGIVVSSPSTEEKAVLPWNYVYKIVTWKEYLLIYSNRVNAYIVPKDAIAANYETIINCIKKNVEDYKLTIK